MIRAWKIGRGFDPKGDEEASRGGHASLPCPQTGYFAMYREGDRHLLCLLKEQQSCGNPLLQRRQERDGGEHTGGTVHSAECKKEGNS